MRLAEHKSPGQAFCADFEAVCDDVTQNGLIYWITLWKRTRLSAEAAV
jgi:hypothetical protein